jgi:hypothetical protein
MCICLPHWRYRVHKIGKKREVVRYQTTVDIFRSNFDLIDTYVQSLHTFTISATYVHVQDLIYQFGNIIVTIVRRARIVDGVATYSQHILSFYVTSRDCDGIPTDLLPIVKYKNTCECGRIWCHDDCMNDIR